MIRRIVARGAWAIFVVWATLSLTFLVNSVLPTDPARMVAGPQARPQDVDRIRVELGLDRPIYVQYARFWRRLVHLGVRARDDAQKKLHANCAALGPLHLDLGRSFQQRRPVVTVLGERLPRTLLLAAAAATLQAALGVTAGVVAAASRRRRLDDLLLSASLVGVSAPTFLLGLLAQWLFAQKLRLLPLDGFGETAIEHARSLVLPAFTLGIFGAAYYTRMVRDEMRGELEQDYVRTAQAKGLGRAGVVVRHALRNSLTTIVTIFGLELGTLVGGAIVTEAIFRWPGLGLLSVNAMLDRDGPMIMGCVFVTSIAVVVSTLVVDALYVVLDPRLRR